MPPESITRSRVEKFALGRGSRAGYRGALHVGLLNNMPDAQMRSAELQFAKLLKEASGVLDVRLHLFSLPEIARDALTRSRMEGFYADVASLPSAGLDALIVAGGERGLRQETAWPALTRLIDWAQSGTLSTLFSGGAVRDAVMHLDAIAEQALPQKMSGVFVTERLSDDPLLAGMPPLTQVPHLRRSEIPESALVARGYRILSRIPYGGVDLFTRPADSLFIFTQGHPEFDAGSLGREFLRDMAVFLQGAAERPAIPENYFDRMTEDRLYELAGQASGPDDLPRHDAVIRGAIPLLSWRGATLKFFANWLAVIAAEKMRRSARSPGYRVRRRA